VVIEIGANVGFASLFFARQLPDVIVEGFEPVPATYERALKNLSLNPELAKRIRLHNYGLAADDSEAKILFDRQRPGNATLIKENLFTASVAEEVPVKLRRASDVIREVRDRHSGRRVIVKIDCEGSEYQILDELESSGSLRQIDCVLAEWHRVSSTVNGGCLRSVFARNGFLACISDRFATGAPVGMLYAFRAGAA
jgi:FkbM family methyltransferase